MRDSGDPETIFFNMEDNSFISVLDALKGRFNGLVQGCETVLHGCSSTISLRIEVKVVYNPSDALAELNMRSGRATNPGQIR